MRFSTIVIITLLILALYYYTAETFNVVKTVGKYVFHVVKDAALVRSVDEYNNEVTNDIKSIPEKIKSIPEKIVEIVKNIKKRFEKET